MERAETHFTLMKSRGKFGIFLINCVPDLLNNRQGLVSTPFAPLTQQYEQCNYSPKVTFIQVAGITMGNIYLLLPFCALFFVILFQAYKTCCGGYHENLYTEFEVKQAVKTLSTALLLARDGKVSATADGARTRTVSGVTSTNRSIDSLVLKLAAELEDLTEAFKNHRQSTVAATAVATPVASSSTLQSSLIAQDSMSKAENGTSDTGRTSTHSVSVDNTPNSGNETEERNSNNLGVSPIHRL